MLHWLRKYKTLLTAPVLAILVMASITVLAQQCLIKNVPQNTELTSAIKQNHSESQKTLGHECCSSAQSEETFNHLCCDLDQVGIDNTIAVSNNSNEIKSPYALLPENDFKLFTVGQNLSQSFHYHSTILTHQKYIARNIVLLN